MTLTLSSRVGHRRASWVLEDPDALIELRARARTFDGACKSQARKEIRS